MLGRLVRRRSAPVEERSVSLAGGWWPYLLGNWVNTSAGEPVTANTALRHSAVWACVNKIAASVSSMPLDQFRYVDDDRGRVPVAPSQIITAPSVMVPASAWRYQALVSMLLRGNVYGLVTSTGGPQMNYPTSIELLHPDQVRVETGSGGFRWFVDSVEEFRWPQGRLWHVPAYVVPGSPVGLSPVEYAAETIGAGLAAERYGASFFGSGGAPSAMIQSRTALTMEQAEQIKHAWRRAVQNAQEPAVMGADLSYTPISINPEDSQFLDAQRFSIEQVCRVFGVPPEMLGVAPSGASLTYANREERAVDFVTFTLGPWLARLEEALSGCVPNRNVVRFNTGALLRASLMDRYQAHAIALTNGWRSVNEVRRIEDEQGIGSDGDVYKPLIDADEPDDPDVMPDDEPRSEFVELRADESTTVVAPNVHVHITTEES